MKTYLFIDGTNLYAAQYELFYASYTPRNRKKKITKKAKVITIDKDLSVSLK